MSAHGPIEYRDAGAKVRAVFDDIERTRQIDDVNNFWKYLAHDPVTLMAVVGMANETNRLADSYRVPIGPAFER